MATEAPQQLEANTQVPQEPVLLSKDIQINVGIVESIIGLVIFLFILGVGWGSLKKAVSHIENTLDKDIKPDLKDISRKVAVLWADKYAPASSPRQLNDLGKNILNDSGIKIIVDEKKEQLIELVKKSSPSNAYDAQKAIEDVMTHFPEHFPETVNRLKEGAFKEGADINSLLYVGSIYLRNEIFSDLGFKIDDLD